MSFTPRGKFYGFTSYWRRRVFEYKLSTGVYELYLFSFSAIPRSSVNKSMEEILIVEIAVNYYIEKVC